MLLQDLELPDIRPCSSSQLSPSMIHPSSPSPPLLEPFVFEEPLEDPYGQVLVRTGSINSTRTIISTSFTDSTSQDSSRVTQDFSRDIQDSSRDVITTSSPELLSTSNIATTSSTSLPPSETASSSTLAPVSQTTLWRKHKKLEWQASLGEDGLPPRKQKERNPYQCSKCGKPKSG